MMKRVLLVVAYDGTNYHGWQIQPNGNTIEAELNHHLSELLSETITVTGASRTDAGVHARCNLAVFDTSARIPAEKISYALNQRLPEDIRIRRSMEVEPEFHPRCIETEKTYEYVIWNDRFPLPTKRLYSHFTYYHLDEKLMQQAADLLVGVHDFKSFCSIKSEAESTVREITGMEVERNGNEIVIRVTGKGFLYNMVRIIAGTLMEIGQGFYPPEKITEILTACDRSAAGPTAPAHGLTLTEYRIFGKSVDTPR